MFAAAFAAFAVGLLVGGLLLCLRALEAPLVPLPVRPPSRPGIWFMAHRADRRFPFQHLFLRLTPADPAWVQRRPDLFARLDDGGRPYCTLGAGPVAGRLFLEFNRGFDLADPVGFEERAGTEGPGGEDGAIAALLEAAAAYGQGLTFSSLSRISGPGYNCNSMVHELAARAGLGLPRFARVWMLCPGIGRRLPPRAFRGAGDRAPGAGTP